MNKASLQQGQDETSGYQLDIRVPIHRGLARGLFAIGSAKATLTLKGLPQENQSITFSITGGSATFGNGRNEIDHQMTQTDGSVTVSLFDSKTETGEIVAWMTENPVVRSNVCPYSFWY